MAIASSIRRRPARLGLHLFVLVAAIIAFTNAQYQPGSGEPGIPANTTPGNKSDILWPVGGEVFFQADTVNTSIITPFRWPRVKTWCIDKSKPPKTNQMGEVNATAGPGWVYALVPMTQNMTVKENCWLNVAPGLNETWDDKVMDSTLRFTINASERPDGKQVVSAPSARVSSTPIETPVIETKPTEPAPAQSGGLGAGAIAGIVIGVVGGLALLFGLGFLCWRRRRRTAATGGNPELDGTPVVAHEKFSPTSQQPHEKYSPTSQQSSMQPQQYAQGPPATHSQPNPTGYYAEMDGGVYQFNDNNKMINLPQGHLPQELPIGHNEPRHELPTQHR